MSQDGFHRDYPNEIAASWPPSDVVYVRLPEHFAVHGPLPETIAPSRVAFLPAEDISICRGAMPDPRGMAAGATITPVYASGGSGTPSVPTGLVFLRFADTVVAEGRRDEIERAGYVVADLVAYAPQAAWLRASSGEIADALAHLDRLASLPDVAAVTPQFLAPVARR